MTQKIMRLMNPFDPNTVSPDMGLGQLPIGKHKVVLSDGEVKANSSNTGGLLALTLKVIEGPLKDSTGGDYLNLYHSNAQTVEIAMKRFSAYCHATKQFRLGDDGKDFTVLFNIPFWIEVGAQKSDETKTEVKKVFAIEAGEEQQQNQQQQTGSFGGGQQNNNTGFGQQNQQQNTGFGQQQQTETQNTGFGNTNQAQNQQQNAGGWPAGGGFGGGQQNQAQNNNTGGNTMLWKS